MVLRDRAAADVVRAAAAALSGRPARSSGLDVTWVDHPSHGVAPVAGTVRAGAGGGRRGRTDGAREKCALARSCRARSRPTDLPPPLPPPQDTRCRNRLYQL